MTIRQQGGVFGRNPKFNDVEATDVTIDSNASVGGELTVTGDAGFGTTNPSKPVHVYSTSSLDHILIDGSVTSRSLGWATNGSARWNLYATSTAESGSNAGSNLRLATYTDAGVYNGRVMDFYRDTKDVMITSGNLIIGTSGKGIDFSATSGTGTSELFDDYEEGSYTPIFQDVTQPTYVSQEGRYTKIGDVVYFYIKVDYSGLNTTDPSTLSLTLPYTVSKSGSGGIINGSTNTGYVGTSTDNITVSCSEGGAKILITTNNSYNDGDYNSGRWAAAGVLNFAGWYFAA